MKKYSIIVAVEENNGIGKGNSIPWKLPEDLKYFKYITLTTSDPLKKNAVIMGRKTWDSIPELYRPLTGRVNIVISNTMAHHPTAVVCNTLKNSIEYCEINSDIESVFVIGGSGNNIFLSKNKILFTISITLIFIFEPIL